MKICVISMYDKSDGLLYEIGHKNHAAYCKAHGYTYYEETGMETKYGSRWKPSFYKPLVIYSAMQAYPDSDWYMWIDMDAYFTNFNTGIDKFVKGRAADHVYVAKDCNGRRCMYDYGYINGCIILGNSYRTREFIHELTKNWIYELFVALKKHKMTWFTDQAMMQFLNKVGPWHSIVVELPAKGFHCTWKNYKAKNAWGDNADFCIHLAGCSNLDRLTILDDIGYNLTTGQVGMNIRGI